MAKNSDETESNASALFSGSRSPAPSPKERNTSSPVALLAFTPSGGSQTSLVFGAEAKRDGEWVGSVAGGVVREGWEK